MRFCQTFMLGSFWRSFPVRWGFRNPDCGSSWADSLFLNIFFLFHLCYR